ncbi:MAG: S-methyl-5-thioribose-1-phosphate isomerase, partial [Promethearchaeota archaeon]
MIDQTQLPGKLVFLELDDYLHIAQAIKVMNIRGAPAIGVAAAFGLALAAREFESFTPEKFIEKMNEAAVIFRQTRPTAVNLFWAIDRIMAFVVSSSSSSAEPKKISENILNESLKMWQEDIDTNRAMGKHGAELLDDGDTVLTHCNAGSLATVQYGTALAPIRWAIQEQNKNIQVIADETRPRLQGARLTAWELHYDKIPVQV